MKIYLKNTLTDKIEVFKPQKRGRVGMYHCGPTVYNQAHIGNLSAYIFSDTLRRLFENQGYKINQVINITDVGHLTDDGDDGEDKIEKASQSTGLSAAEITKKYTDLFMTDLVRLNIPVDKITFPKATNHIAEQIELIQKLEKAGLVYEIKDGVYFDTGKYEGYGKLGQVDIEGLKEGARVEKNNEKRNPTDFALWKFSGKFSENGEKRQQEWDSPWGVGFPGWHIECSAMSRKYLGENFDIHTGGIDHIPIHHNNEIAQSEGAYNKPLSRYWLHFNHIMLNGEKISKSIGNVVYLDDLLDRNFDIAAFRYWFLTSHYSTPADFTWESLTAVQNAFNKLKNFIKENSDTKNSAAAGKIIKKYYKKALRELTHDLGTPEVIATIWELIKDEKFNGADKVATILELDKFLGFGLDKIKKDEIPTEIVELAKKRDEARKDKNFTLADQLRNEISQKGFVVKDSSDGFVVESK
jgi:cysteinyl-tRNA synthetase